MCDNKILGTHLYPFILIGRQHSQIAVKIREPENKLNSEQTSVIACNKPDPRKNYEKAKTNLETSVMLCRCGGDRQSKGLKMSWGLGGVFCDEVSSSKINAYCNTTIDTVGPIFTQFSLRSGSHRVHTDEHNLTRDKNVRRILLHCWSALYASCHGSKYALCRILIVFIVRSHSGGSRRNDDEIKRPSRFLD